MMLFFFGFTLGQFVALAAVFVLFSNGSQQAE